MSCQTNCAGNDLTRLIRKTVEGMCLKGSPLNAGDGLLQIVVSDATDLPLSSVCASSKAVSDIGKRCREAEKEADKALEGANKAELAAKGAAETAANASGKADLALTGMQEGEKEIASLSVKIRETEKRCAASGELAAKAGLMAAEAARKADECREHTDSLTETQAGFAAQIDAMRTGAARLEKAQEEAAFAIGVLQGKAEELQDKSESQLERLAAYELQLTACAARTADLETRLGAQEEKSLDLAEEVEGIQAATEELRTDAAGLEERLSDCGQSIDSLADGQSQQTAQIASLLSFKEDTEERVGNLETGQDNIETRLNNTETGLETAIGDLDALAAAHTLDQLNNETRLTALENTASAEAPGLMSISDKNKLDGIEAGAQVNPTLEELGGLSKSGGTMTGNMGIANDEPTFYLDNLNDVQKAAPLSGDASSMVRLRDKDKNTVAYLNYTHSADGNRKWLLQLMGQGAAGWRNLDYNVTPDGYATLSTPSHPDMSENGAVYVDAWWVNQKLGSGASVASLALLNETDAAPDPLETARKEAIARVNADAQQAIYQGFLWELDGQEVLVPYSLFDQVNLNSLAIAVLDNPDALYPLSCRSMAGEDLFLDVSAQAIREICAYGAINHRAAILRDVHERKQRILAAMDETEIRSAERGN